jgi:uncharacterized protein YaiE (UPF0345 family)
MGTILALPANTDGDFKAILRAILGRAVRGELASLEVTFTTTEGERKTVVAGRYKDAPTQVIKLRRPT